MSENEHTQQFIDRMETLRREHDAEVATWRPSCPQDGLPGTFIGEVGSAQIVVPVFACPNGDRFSYRPDNARSKLILPEHWHRIHLMQREDPSGAVSGPNDLSVPYGDTPDSGDAR